MATLRSAATCSTQKNCTNSKKKRNHYASGTNHTLPTYGYARTASSLGLADYQRRYTVQELSATGLQGLANTVTTMADAEGLDAHKRAVTIRMDVIRQEQQA